MLFLIWEQDYDYAGACVVEGPEGSDVTLLRKEFYDLLLKHQIDKYLVDKVSEFETNTLVEFVNWLVGEKGFRRVEYKRVGI
jgi:hypothetical protein